MKRNSTTRSPRLILLALLLLAASTTVLAQTQPIESGKFRLHKFEQPIGEETYTLARDGDSLLVNSNFEFTDRGRKVPLSATLKLGHDLTPQSFNIKGSISRLSTIDDEVQIDGKNATIREGQNKRQAQVPNEFFTIAGYAPVTMQQMLIRYVIENPTERPIPTLPSGSVTIVHVGKDNLPLKDRRVDLERYRVTGLIWGRESLWFDSNQNLVAAVTVDAEFDHFEAVRDGYESGLPVFVGMAAEDGMASLAELSKQISPETKGPLAITGGTLIDGTGGAPLANSVVVISGNRIEAVGPAGKVRIPKGARRIDARGKFLLPGLWDMHAHFEQVEWGPIYLAAGVTTVRDVGNEFEFIATVRDAINQGKGLGPRMLLAGIVDGDSPRAIGIIRANTADEARTVVDRYHAEDFQQIKIYSSVKPDVVKAICDEAHKLGMTVTGHIPNGMNAIQGVEAGMDQINHVQYLPAVLLPKDFRPQPGQPPPDLQSPEAQRAIQVFKSHGTVFDPTLATFEWALHPASTPYSTIEPGAAKLPVELNAGINNTGAPPEQAQQSQWVLNLFLAIVGALHRAGLTVVAGTDQTVPGHSLHREIELYVKAGFTPMEAIQAATIVPARVMKVEKEVGTVEAGKRADVIILNANPLAEISNIRTVMTVIANGRVYDTAQLWKSVGFKP